MEVTFYSNENKGPNQNLHPSVRRTSTAGYGSFLLSPPRKEEQQQQQAESKQFSTLN